MGCRCDTNKDINAGEYNFDEENNNNFINLINLKNQRNSTEADLQEIQMMHDRFLGEIQNRGGYEILDSINLKEYLTYECLQAYKIFTNDKQKFIKIINEYEKDFINDKSETIKIVKYLKCPQLDILKTILFMKVNIILMKKITNLNLQEMDA